ncbi:type IV secretion system protein VirB9 [Novosphingobium sp. PhB165]|uniref:P-type conjugative transfer protein TrbG n=1 Tax=Novosphingobium sp. PhB165 TaxID=2485105 RepID=UPI0010498AB7|nr:P-type conjugative transfer protein TrbG [Novosphingobium sp. PhB165]TCM15067.1 type IV secretion system protein VirB9 [Novosphingobium sp. PhB165]
MNVHSHRLAIIAGVLALPVLGHPALAAPAPSSRAAVVDRANRAATIEPQASGFVQAIQLQAYSEGAIYHVLTAPDRVTDIALQAGEGLVAVASGDTARWVIGDTTSGQGDSKRTHILVKPYSPGLSTNLVITTDRRSYHLALSSSGGAAISALSWTYPADELVAIKRAAAAAETAKPIAAGLSAENLNFNYEISGDKPTWRPLRAFDDGRQTFIQLPPSIVLDEAPPLFLVDEKGTAQLVNYRLSGRFYVVDRIFTAAELRLGTKNQQVVRIQRVAEGAVQERAR